MATCIGNLGACLETILKCYFIFTFFKRIEKQFSNLKNIFNKLFLGICFKNWMISSNKFEGFSIIFSDCFEKQLERQRIGQQHLT